MRRLFVALALATAACQPIEKTTTPEIVDPAFVVADPAPPPVDPKLVELAAALDRSALAADRRSVVTTRVRVSASTAESAQRPPLWLVLVVDTSGSMAGTAIHDARAAASALVKSLRDGDHIGIVTFDSRVAMLVPPTEIGKAGRAVALRSIETMEARGTTDMASGLSSAHQLFSQAPAGSARRLVMLSDGVPNEPSALPGLAQAYRNSGIAMTTLGFGLEYDETLLGQLAQASGGSFHRVGEGEALAKAFVDEAFRVERVVASNVVLALQAGPGVEIGRVLGHPAVSPGSRTHSVALGELSEGQHQDVFVELTVTGHRDGANVELVDASVTFDERTVNAGRLERRSFVAAKASADEDVVARGRDLVVEREAARARAATATLDAIALGRGGQFIEARALLEDAEKAARGRATDDPELKTLVEEMTKLRKNFAAEAKAQAAAAREIARKAKLSGGLEPGTEPTKVPMPTTPQAALGIKESHARAIGTMQPHE